MGRPKRRRLGQNFLADRGVAERIAALLASEPARVLEVGPGRGALTAPLLERFPRVLALEMDPSLLPGLGERFSGSGLEVRHADAVREPLEPLLGPEAPWQVASNLPYSVGSAILRRLLPLSNLISRVVVMLQREVVERLLADPGGSGHGLMALERAAYADARLAFHVQPGVFRPPPKVTSSVVVLDLHPAPAPAAELERALALAAHALTMPRKKLANTLKGRLDVAAIAAAGIDPDARPGTLALADWLTLARV